MFENLKITDQHIYRGGQLPAMTAHSYQYILAGNGVFVQAQNRHWQMVIQIAACQVRGLATLTPQLICRHGKLPSQLLSQIVANARQARNGHGSLVEALYWIQWDAGHWTVEKPPQTATAARVTTQKVADQTVVIEMHTHAEATAFFSATDNRDEQGLGVYGVLGSLHQPQVELCMRVGVYGYFQQVALTQLFDSVPPDIVTATKQTNHDTLILPYPHAI